MNGLFRAFERERVESLLIGGQAAILYGASHFTQDLDLWIRPTASNVHAFLRALSRVGARIHKLTPPLTLRWIRSGHGFHFVVPQPGSLPAYLDAMGVPPRTKGFSPASRRARIMKTPWGLLRVVSPEDLVEMKKTNRPGDYEAISRLVRIRLGELKDPTSAQTDWAGRNCFRIEDLLAVLSGYGKKLRRMPAGTDRSVSRLIRLLREGRKPPEGAVASAGRALDAAMSRRLEEGRRYWLPRVRELKELRAAGGLLPEGLAVRELL